MSQRKTDGNVHLEDGIYWIGEAAPPYSLHSNPYLIVDGDEAVVIDGGSRPEFSTVMLKIMQTGIRPDQIKALIYHHYDPDLCGSISHFEELIGNPELVTISQRHNNVFIHHYGTRSKKLCINAIRNEWRFSSGRRLVFINTPYAHSPGSFVTWDEQTGTLFSSDLFGSYSKQWQLYFHMEEACVGCSDFKECPRGKTCFMLEMESFHNLIMTSTQALRMALDSFRSLQIRRIAPQHGSIIEGETVARDVLEKLYRLDAVGIDGAAAGKIYPEAP